MALIRSLTVPLALAIGSLANVAPAQQRLPNPPESALPAPPYAEYADLVLAAPSIIDAGVRSVTRLKGPDAVGVAPGFARLYIQADVLAQEKSELSKLDELESEIAKELGATKQRD